MLRHTQKEAVRHAMKQYADSRIPTLQAALFDYMNFEDLAPRLRPDRKCGDLGLGRLAWHRHYGSPISRVASDSGCLSATFGRFLLPPVDEKKPGTEVRFVMFCPSAAP